MCKFLMAYIIFLPRVCSSCLGHPGLVRVVQKTNRQGFLIFSRLFGDIIGDLFPLKVC